MRNLNSVVSVDTGFVSKVISDVDIEESDGFDPFQAFFDFLLASGKQAGDAWDEIWANPLRASEIGWALTTQTATA